MKDYSSVLAFVDQVRKTLTPEGRVSAKEGIGYDAHRPHIDWLAMPFLEHYFGSGVAKRTSHGREYFVFGVKHLGNAKVC